jgi:hypothetical protein
LTQNLPTNTNGIPVTPTFIGQDAITCRQIQIYNITQATNQTSHFSSFSLPPSTIELFARAYCTTDDSSITINGIIWQDDTILQKITTTSSDFHEPTQQLADTLGVYCIAQYLAQLTKHRPGSKVKIYLPTKRIFQQITTAQRDHCTPTQTYFPTWDWCHEVADLANTNTC